MPKNKIKWISNGADRAVAQYGQCLKIKIKIKNIKWCWWGGSPIWMMPKNKNKIKNKNGADGAQYGRCLKIK